MLISIPKKLILLPNTHAARIKAVIPHAQAFREWIVVPYRIDETITLRNIGFAIPSPIESYYNWPGRYTPFMHQRTTAAFLTLNKRAFVLNDIGTGKTLSAYWAFDFLRRVDRLKKCLVVAPLSTLERVHAETIFQNFPHLRFCVLYGTAARRKQLLEADFDIYIINHDGLRIVAPELRRHPEIDLVLVDELAAYRNAQTDKWKVLKSVVTPERSCWGMTGTPTPNEPTDAYAQIKLVRPENLTEYHSFRGFKQSTMDQINMYLWRAKPNAMHVVYSTMRPSIRFNRDECLDLPPCTYQTLDVELTEEQRKAYKDLMKTFVTEVAGGRVVALNEAIKVMRLVQTVSGTLYDEEGIHRRVDCAPRLNVLKEIIAQTDRKVIVFVPFKGNLTHLKEELATKTLTVACISGDTATGERNAIFKAFQTGAHPKVLLAHPGTMAHGLTLTEAATIVWWAPVMSNDIYTQANGRINRAGQEHKTTIIHLAGTMIEREIYERLEAKQKLQGLLLTMVQEKRGTEQG